MPRMRSGSVVGRGLTAGAWIVALACAVTLGPDLSAAQKPGGPGGVGRPGGIGGPGGVGRPGGVGVGGYRPGGAVVVNGGGYGGYGYGYGNYGGGTVAGSYYNGLGNALQGAGQYNLNTAQANVENQQARSMQIDNHVRQTEAYFQLRDMWAKEKAKTATPKRTPEEWARFNKAPRPPRLTASEFDATTGALKWPLLLDTSAYAAQREVVDKIMAQRAVHGGSITGDDYNVLSAKLQEMQTILQGKINDVPSGEFMKGKKFLQSIDYEVASNGGEG